MKGGGEGTRASLKQEGKEERGTNATEREGEKGGFGGGREEGVKRKRGMGRTRRREKAGIRRNKRGIFVPATNPNGEKRTFLFSFTRQPTYPPTFMSAVSED